MSAIRSTGNKTAVALRKELHAAGLRFRVEPPTVFGKPDVVFPGPRVAVFVDGDYWHGREYQEGGMNALESRIKTPNRDYWLKKIPRNVARDKTVTAALIAEGWKVFRFWESDLRKDPRSAVREIRRAVRSRSDRRPTA